MKLNPKQLWLPLFAMQKGNKQWNCPRCGGGVIGIGGYGYMECQDCWIKWKVKKGKVDYVF